MTIMSAPSTRSAPPSVALGSCLRRRTFSSYHEIVGAPQRAGKVSVAWRQKRYLGIRVRYPPSWYVRFKYGIRDLQKNEFEVLTGLPQELHRHLPQDLALAQTQDGQTVLCANLVRDHDGEPSSFLSDLPGVDDPTFWKEMEAMAETFRRRRLYFLSAFTPGNFLVERVGPEASRPVLWPDVSKCGRTLFPYQFHLLLGPVLRRKFERRVRRFFRQHRR